MSKISARVSHIVPFDIGGDIFYFDDTKKNSLNKYESFIKKFKDNRTDEIVDEIFRIKINDNVYIHVFSFGLGCVVFKDYSNCDICLDRIESSIELLKSEKKDFEVSLSRGINNAKTKYEEINQTIKNIREKYANIYKEVRKTCMLDFYKTDLQYTLTFYHINGLDNCWDDFDKSSKKLIHGLYDYTNINNIEDVNIKPSGFFESSQISFMMSWSGVTIFERKSVDFTELSSMIFNRDIWLQAKWHYLDCIQTDARLNEYNLYQYQNMIYETKILMGD